METLWIEHKVRAMEIILVNYSILQLQLQPITITARIKSLSQTASQALKRTEIECLAEK